MIKKGVLAGLLLLFLIGTQVFALSGVTGHWAQEEAEHLMELGVLQGDGNGDARLDDSVTRAEFTAMLVRALYPEAEGSGSGGVFADVSESDWFADAVGFAYRQGLARGDGERFYPQRNVSREEMVLLLTRALSLSGEGKSFRDVPKDYPYYSQIGAAAGAGLIRGFPDNTFRPTAGASRGEAAVILSRAIRLSQGEELPTDEERINLTWHQIYNKNVTSTGEFMEGVNVISPTWFAIEKVDAAESYQTALADTGLVFTDYSNDAYVRDTREKGYALWPILKTDFTTATARTFLQSDAAREEVISLLREVSVRYGLEGINLDFENIYPADKDLYTDFIRQVSELTEELGMVLSVDVTIYHPYGGSWSLGFDRRAIGEIADYVMLMAYDEYYAGSPTAGSVASLPWVESGILTTLEEVPAEKLVLGVPFYTRLWREENGSLTSAALGMQRVQERIAAAGAAVTYDTATGQNYAQWYEGNAYLRVWLEDETSVQARMALIKQYGLAGVASWSKEFPTSDIWQILDQEL